LSELSPSQVVALRFPDLSPAQIVVLRSPEVSAFGASAASGSPSLVDLIDFQVAPTLPPVGHSWFCLRDPDDCKFHAIDLRHPNVGLMPERGNELSSVDRNVNRSIVAELTPANGMNGMTALGTTTATTSGSPSPLVHLIDFQVAPTLPPIGHSRFCRRYPDDCKVHAIDFRHRNIALTPERGNELSSVDRNVNRSIVAELTPGNGRIEEWAIAPRFGDCTDYAITKRHELLARGWPSSALLLSEVTLPSGEHHLLLVGHLENIDLVLDNLNDEVRTAAMTYNQYVWLRIQSPQNPKFWVRVL
jgi:predicted transglutaminase-like cysteine proteinase